MDKETNKMIPGDELHLTMLMAPYSLNLVSGQDRQHLLAFGRAAFDAGKADRPAQCLHQITEEGAHTPDDKQIKALMRKHRIWIEHSTLLEDDEPERELRAVQAEEHQFNAFVQDLIAATQPAAQGMDGREFPPLTPELASILGLMCFQCISFAQTLRAAGHTIKTRAEDEQAAVLHWMLGHYFRHGDDWRTAAAEDMKRMEAEALAAQPKQGGDHG